MFDIRKFGRYLYDLRMEKKMTQLQLGMKLNVSRQTISKYEMGQSFPDIQILILLADIFGRTVDDLVSCGASEYDIDSVLSMAPIIKDDVLSESLKFVSDINKKLNSGDFSNIDEDTLMKIIPFVDDTAKEIIFHKVIDGDISYKILYELIPYSNNIQRLIEAAVLDGAIDREAMDCIYEQQRKIVRKEDKKLK